MLKSLAPADIWWEIDALVYDRWIDKVPSTLPNTQTTEAAVRRCS